MGHVEKMYKSGCIVCGRDLPWGKICEDCEREVLREAGSKAQILSTITTVFLLLILYKLWEFYTPVIWEVDASKMRSFSLLLGALIEILRSPKLFPFLVIGSILLTFALLFKVYYKKFVKIA